MTRLSAVLSPADLPEPELHAAKLDGELYRLDASFCPIDEIETPAHRALALSILVPAGLIAEQRTAAWIYGVTECPDRHQFCASVKARVRPGSPSRVTVREVVIDGDELWQIAGLPVTSPLRTVLDLARFSPVFDIPELAILTGLMRVGGFGVADCIDAVTARRNLPAKRLALTRLKDCLR